MLYKLIAHRGLTSVAPENSLKALTKALDTDCAGFECDVRPSKDKKLVIHHDPLYKGNLVINTSYKTMKKEGIILLDDVLNIKTNKIMVIDIKYPFINIDTLHEKLESHSNKNIYVISFYDNVIKKLFNKKRHYKLGVLNYVLNTTDHEFSYDFVCLLMNLTSDSLIERFKKLNKEVFIYGVDDKNKITNLYPYYILNL